MFFINGSVDKTLGIEKGIWRAQKPDNKFNAPHKLLNLELVIEHVYILDRIGWLSTCTFLIELVDWARVHFGSRFLINKNG